MQDYLKNQDVRDCIRRAMIDSKGHMMICGNKQTLGRAILSGLIEGNTQVFTEAELNEMKQTG